MLLNLKAVLAVRKMRQLDLAFQLKISPTVLSEILHGHRKPEPGLADRIGAILNADRDWLFSSRFVIPKAAVAQGDAHIRENVIERRRTALGKRASLKLV